MGASGVLRCLYTVLAVCCMRHLVPTPEAFAARVAAEFGPAADLAMVSRLTACGRRSADLQCTEDPTLTTCKVCARRGEALRYEPRPAVRRKPQTPITNFRIPPEVKAAAKARADERGETLTDVVVRSLKRYGRGK